MTDPLGKPLQTEDGISPVVKLDLGSPRLDGAGSDVAGDQVAALQDRIAELDNKLHEERFLWVLVLVCLFDVYFIMSADNWAAPLVIGILQLIGLAVFADKCRVNPIMPLLDRLTGMLGNGRSRS